MKLALCIPTLNAADTAQAFLAALSSQTCTILERWIVDSQSDDSTSPLFESAGFRVHSISRGDFNHGGSRQAVVDLCPDAEIIVFLTQDAILANSDAIQRLVDCFDDPAVGAAYGCQLPRVDAAPIETHARMYNYPQQSMRKTFADRCRYGIKTAFLSNSFAAYRRQALTEAGGFPQKVILGEDTYVAARMLLNGWDIFYCAGAKVYHSHDYTIFEEFKRYFDIGAFHGSEDWLRGSFGKAEGEGVRFMMSEFRYLWTHAPHLLPAALIRSIFKYLGYKIGSLHNVLPRAVCRSLSMNRNFW